MTAPAMAKSRQFALNGKGMGIANCISGAAVANNAISGFAQKLPAAC